MTTLISWASSGGATSRCDAKCYDADSPPAVCTCICGGRNHGAGREQAVDNTRQHFKTMLADFSGMPRLTAQFCIEARQQTLFE